MNVLYRAEKAIDITSIFATLYDGALSNIEKYIFFILKKYHNGQNGSL